MYFLSLKREKGPNDAAAWRSEFFSIVISILIGLGVFFIQGDFEKLMKRADLKKGAVEELLLVISMLQNPADYPMPGYDQNLVIKENEVKVALTKLPHSSIQLAADSNLFSIDDTQNFLIINRQITDFNVGVEFGIEMMKKNTQESFSLAAEFQQTTSPSPQELLEKAVYVLECLQFGVSKSTGDNDCR
jgi:hypothetical protein